MYVDYDNIVDHMGNESFVPKVHWTISFTSKWMYAVYENIEYRIRDESLL